MVVRITQVGLVIILVFSIGMHWMILQSVAWFGMAVNYAQKAPLTEALIKTFDGSHPCELCKFIAHGKATERKQHAPQTTKKLELALSGEKFCLQPPELEPLIEFSSRLLIQRDVAPPKRPPRCSVG